VAEAAKSTRLQLADEFLTAGARAAEEFLKRIQYEAEIGPFQAKHI